MVMREKSAVGSQRPEGRSSRVVDGSVWSPLLSTRPGVLADVGGALCPDPMSCGGHRGTKPLLRVVVASLACFLSLALPAAACAQRVYWEPNHGVFGFGKTSELDLVFEDCAPQGDVDLPAIAGLEIEHPSVSQETSINFGQSSSRVVLRYPVQPTGRDDVVIPAFDVRTDHGTIAVGEVRFTIGDATVGQSTLKISDIVTSSLQPARTTMWAGEVVNLDYTLLASPRFRPQIASAPEWKSEGILAESFGDFDDVRATVSGETRAGARYHTRFAATKPGSIKLAPVRQTVNLQTGERSGFIFAQPRIESFTIASDQPEITVRPLPSPAPAGFTGAVGDFKLDSKIVPQTAHVGEPITWTMTLRGVGNWPANPALPAREVSADFQVVQPQPRQKMDDGRLFSGSVTEDAVLVPTRPGTYTIGPVKFAWFDTATGAYRESPIPAVTVTIQPPASAPSPTTPSPTEATTPAETGAPGSNPAASHPLPPDLSAPGQLPREPLGSSGLSFAPHGLAWWWWLPLALAVPVVVWLGLAWRLMNRSDPYQARRTAQRELLRLLGTLARTGAAADAASLLTWRQLAAQLWRIDRATPTIEDLATAIERERGAPRPDDWLALWRDAELAIFAAAHALPADWANRALAAARTVRLRRSNPPLPLRLRYWTPTATCLLFALLLAATGTARAHAADAGLKAYREGKFAAARAAWRLEVAAHPRDWALRNNLALACAQDNDWAEATAHWTAAFLLNPREPSIRANLRLALTHLDGVDPQLRRIVEGSWLDRIVTFLSPGEWELAFFAGGGVVAIALTVLVTTLYTRRGRTWRVRVGFTLVAVGVVTSVGGFTGQFLYGPLGDPAAGLVAKSTELRSIPTDLAEHQQTSPISAGAVVVRRGSFLDDWDHVDATHPGAGWLRRETIVPFYSAPPAEKGKDVAL